MSQHYSAIPQIKDLHGSIQAGDTNCIEIAQDCIDKHHQFEPLLNCYQVRNDEQFIDQAKQAQDLYLQGRASLVSGIPVSIKSNFAVSGLPCYAGTTQPLPPKWQQEGTLVRALHELASPVAGLTQASEFAFGGLGINEHWGTPRNPWDPAAHRVPGGSSSGAAISVLSGSAHFAIGTDTGGSIRVPAAANGMVGFKTSKGHWPDDGFVPLSRQFDTLGIICRSVSDVVSVYSTIDHHLQSGGTVSTKTSLAEFAVRIADNTCFDDMEASLVKGFESAIEKLSRAGLNTRPMETNTFSSVFDLLDQGPSSAAVECGRFIDKELPEWNDLLSPTTQGIIERGRLMTQQAYTQRISTLEKLRTKANSELRGIDIFICPTLSITPPPLELLQSKERADAACAGMLRNTVVANIFGYCAISLPIGLDSQQMPIGLQFMAPASHERDLLNFASLVESVLGTGLDQLGMPPMLKDTSSK